MEIVISAYQFQRRQFSQPRILIVEQYCLRMRGQAIRIWFKWRKQVTVMRTTLLILQNSLDSIRLNAGALIIISTIAKNNVLSMQILYIHKFMKTRIILFLEIQSANTK